MPDAKILIVEDEAIEALDIQQRLVGLGYPEPDIAGSGEEGMQKAGEILTDLVLMDIMLPGKLDGIMAAEQIRSRFDIPVIYLTAYGDENTLQRAKITEPYGYIIKPFQERELHIAIDIALYKHKTERRLRESEEWLSTTLKSIGDAIIATDKNGQVSFMNPVAESLTGWKQEEALNRKLGQVFRIINWDTRQPVEDPVARVLREGNVVGLANHTKLIARDGTEMPIDDRAAPIKDNKGHLIGVVLVFRDIIERKKAEEELHRYREHLEELVRDRTRELRELAHRLVDAQEKERMTIGNELHDEIGQLLTYVKLLIDRAARKPDQQTMTEARATVQDAIAKIRNLSSILSPPMLRSGLLQALVSLIEEYKRRTNIKVEFAHTDRLEEVPEGVTLASYRIVQEALTNVARHAKASEVKVRLSQQPGKLRLEVADKGSGFNPREKNHTTGLTGMRERALALGGELSITSSHGHGTRVVAEFPLSETGTT